MTIFPPFPPSACDIGGSFFSGATVTVTNSQQSYQCTTTSFIPPLPNPPQYNVGEHNWVCNNGISILPGNQGLTITASREGDYLNGVSTEDIVHIQNYILGQPPLTQTPYNPFRIIAADVNLSGTVSILDVILIRSVILGNPPAWASGSYRFIPRFYFIGPSSGFCQSFYANPFTAVFNPGNIGYPQYSNGVIAFSTNLSNPLLPWFDLALF